MIAVKERNIEMVKYLVEKGADVNMHNKVSDISVMLCISNFFLAFTVYTDCIHPFFFTFRLDTMSWV